MQKIISRSTLIQKKFISRYSKVHPHEMVLYNEKPQTTISLMVRFDEDKSQDELWNKVKPIRNSSSKTICSTESNYFVLHTSTDRINIPVIEERINSDVTPVISFVDIIKWLAKTQDTGSKDPAQAGTRIGRLDAANEAGFFHRTNRSRLKEIKKKLKGKISSEPTGPKKTG